MSYANVTPTQALSRLLAAAKQINADECKDERVFHALQGEIGVAEGVLRDYVEPEPVAYANAAFFTTRQSEFAQNGTVIFPAKCGEVTMPLYDQPVAAQSAVAAASVPPAILARTEEIRQVMANPMGIGRNALLAYIEFLLAHIAFTNSAAPLHEAGNAAAVQEVLSDAQRQNAELVLERLKDIRHLYPGSHTSALAKEALPCIRAILAASQSPAAAPSIAAPTEVERDADDVPDAWKLMLAGVVNELGATYKSIEQNAPNLVVSLGQFRRLQMAKQFLIDSGLPVIAAIATGEKA